MRNEVSAEDREMLGYVLKIVSKFQKNLKWQIVTFLAEYSINLLSA